jgi:hypothetical protein
MIAAMIGYFFSRPLPTRTRNRRPWGSAKEWRSLVVFGLLLMISGCRTHREQPVLGPFHEIGNYYAVTHPLPIDIRRVAMIPMTSAEHNLASREGRAALQPVLFGEFAKSRLFETVLVNPHQMEEWTGRKAWSPEEKLPADFLVRIREETACDAILFSQLSYYRPYPPLAVGWRLLMIRAHDGLVLWAFDEVFDGGEPPVINSARRYAIENGRTSPQLAKHPGLLNSPRDFAQFAAYAAVQTLK